MTTWRTIAITTGLLLGLGSAAIAQDQDLERLKRQLREEVAKELAPEFQRRAKELRDRFEQEARSLQAEFKRMVEEAVERKLSELHHATPTPPTPPTPVPPPATGGKPYVGLRLAEATEGVRVLLNLGDTGGLVVRGVEAGGPAERAGFKLEDVILSFAGERVGTLPALRDILGRCRGGQVVTVELLREGRKHRVELTLGGGGADAPPVAPRTPDPAPHHESPRQRIHRLLRGLRDGLLDRVQAQLEQAVDPAEREELMRIVARKLLEQLGSATEADRAEMMRALRFGLQRYLAGAGAQAKDRAAALEELLEGMLHGSGAKQAKRDVGKLLDDILGKPGKKPGEAHPQPTQPDVPELDPDKLRDELERLKLKIEAEGFPQDEAGVRELVDSLLKRMKTTREQVRRLIEMMGGPEGAKALVKQQLEMNGIPLTDADLERVMKVLMEEGSGGGDAPATRVPAGKIGLRLEFVAEGARVLEVTPGSAAAAAGIVAGDLIVTIGDASASNRDAVKAELSGRFVGQRTKIRLRRDGGERTVVLTFAK